jgi:hypothetical protein
MKKFMLLKQFSEILLLVNPKVFGSSAYAYGEVQVDGDGILLAF